MATTYLWVTLGRFDGASRTVAGPYEELNAAMAAGRELAQQAGQDNYTMAEFDSGGNQISDAVPWNATLDISAPEPAANRATSPNDAPARGPAELGEPPPVTDGLADVYVTPAQKGADSHDRAPASHWARKRRQRAARSGRSRRR